VIAPIIGGFLSNPVSQYPSTFNNSNSKFFTSLFSHFPYLLPCLCLMIFQLIGLSCALLKMKETNVENGKTVKEFLFWIWRKMKDQICQKLSFIFVKNDDQKMKKRKMSDAIQLIDHQNDQNDQNEEEDDDISSSNFNNSNEMDEIEMISTINNNKILINNTNPQEGVIISSSLKKQEEEKDQMKMKIITSTSSIKKRNKKNKKKKKKKIVGDGGGMRYERIELQDEEEEEEMMMVEQTVSFEEEEKEEEDLVEISFLHDKSSSSSQTSKKEDSKNNNWSIMKDPKVIATISSYCCIALAYIVFDETIPLFFKLRFSSFLFYFNIFL